MEFALIKNSVVKNVIVCESTPALEGFFDDIIRVDELESKPAPKWTYIDGSFTPPIVNTNPISKKQKIKKGMAGINQNSKNLETAHAKLDLILSILSE